MSAPKKRGSKARKGDRKIQVGASDWEALRLRSRTLAALGLGGGLPCPKCGDCLMVKDACPGCGHKHVIQE